MRRLAAPAGFLAGGLLLALVPIARLPAFYESFLYLVFFWIALATFKWGVMCLIQAFTHLNGLVRSVELATIGRRVVENEWDLLTLVGGGW